MGRGARGAPKAPEEDEAAGPPWPAQPRFRNNLRSRLVHPWPVNSPDPNGLLECTRLNPIENISGIGPSSPPRHKHPP